MKILVYSKKKEAETKKGWSFEGKNICHYQNTNRKLGMGGGNFFSLSFSYDAEYDNDEIYIANLFPYTFTDLRNFLAKVCIPANKDKVRKCVLCNTLAGNQ
jgi:hypothetical protein